jgi:glycosyltransferase involved in cell wall biosynthesis
LIISPRGQFGKWCLGQGNKFKKLWLHAFIQPYITKLYWHLTSEAEQKEVLAVYTEARTFIIPNGIDTSVLDNRNQRKDKLFYKKYSEIVYEESIIIISMGRIHKKKGFDILIEAFKKVQLQAQDSILLIAGEDFGEKSNLINLISSQNLTKKIFLVGHIEGEEKINFLKNADVFVLPSHDENFGMVYGEALAAGTPIVASTNAPWQDVEKFNCGKWVENTPDQFAVAITEILNSDSIQMGKNGRKYVEEHCSWDKIAIDFKKQIGCIFNKDIYD